MVVVEFFDVARSMHIVLSHQNYFDIMLYGKQANSLILIHNILYIVAMPLHYNVPYMHCYRAVYTSKLCKSLDQPHQSRCNF